MGVEFNNRFVLDVHHTERVNAGLQQTCLDQSMASSHVMSMQSNDSLRTVSIIIEKYLIIAVIMSNINDENPSIVTT